MSDWQVSSADGIVVAKNGRLELRADHIYKSRTGEHAHVIVSLDDEKLADDLINLLRSEDREKLGRKAWAKFDDDDRRGKAEYPIDLLQAALTRFCARIWPESVRLPDSVECGSDAEPEPPVFPLYPYVMQGGGTIPFGPPKTGKSYLLYLWAVSIDAGCSAMWNVERCPVLVVNLERSAESVKSRLWYVNQALGLAGNRRLRVLNRRGKRLETIYDTVANIVQADGIRVLFLDSISRAGYGNLNDNDVANMVVDALSSLCPTWVALGHTPRADQTHIYGSQMFAAGQDMGVAVRSARSQSGYSLGVALQVVDPNDISPPKPETLALDFDGFHLSGVRRASESEFPALATGRPQDLATQVYDLLLDAGRLSGTEIAAEIGAERSNVARLLSADPRFAVVGKDGKRVLYGVVTTVTE